MKITLMELTDLVQFERNPKKHPKKQIEHIKKSIEEFGWTNPILATKAEKMIVAGHARYQAAKEMNLGKVPVIFLDLPYEKAVAYVIADNRLAELAETDSEKLAELLGELQALPDFDIETVGFTLDDLPSIIQSNNVVSDDDLPEQTTQTNIKIGDIITLGNHKLLCGDAQDKTEIARFLGDIVIDLLYYDPPYETKSLWNCVYDCNKALVFSDNRHILDAFQILSKYTYVYEFVWDTAVSWFLQNRPLCRHRSAYLCQNVPEYDNDGAIYDDGKKRTTHNVTTHKGNYEYQPLEDGVRLSSIYQKNKAQLPAQHGKPIEWIAPIIAGSRAINVLDLFGGSGSTLMACEQLGIPCYIVEIDPVKCQNIVNRFENR